MNNAIKAAKQIFSGSNIKSIENTGSLYIKRCKIVVFVPLKNVNELTFQIASAGAGVIGNYSVCSFRTKGTGTFKAGKTSNPKIGKKGRFEIVEEIRLEMICDKKNLDSIINKIYEFHPYEEPAYDIYEVMVRTKKTGDKAVSVKLEKEITVKNVLRKINASIDLSKLPDKIKNVKVKQAIVDYSTDGIFRLADSKNKTLYIKRNKNITNIEIL
jgi:hypothetical protein